MEKSTRKGHGLVCQRLVALLFTQRAVGQLCRPSQRGSADVEDVLQAATVRFIHCIKRDQNMYDASCKKVSMSDFPQFRAPQCVEFDELYSWRRSETCRLFSVSDPI